MAMTDQDRRVLLCEAPGVMETDATAFRLIAHGKNKLYAQNQSMPDQLCNDGLELARAPL